MTRKNAAAVVVALVAFLLTLFVVLRLVPGPYTQADLLVIGTLPTFAAMLVLFFVIRQRGVGKPRP